MAENLKIAPVNNPATDSENAAGSSGADAGCAEAEAGERLPLFRHRG